MADIELIIKVPEESYNFLKSGYFIDDGTRSGKTILQHFCRAIYNGKPLSKGHGRLIDVNSVYQIVRPIEPSDAEWGMTAETAIRLIHDAFEKAPTIIEADKEIELESN